jgi:catechol 2,3-dioxygenase-like lactoylglutathione lyase family enzyme
VSQTLGQNNKTHTFSMKIKSLNHVALHVADVGASIEFYENKLGLQPLERPLFDFPGAWFDLGEGRQLHLIGGRSLPVHSSNRGTHFALEVDSIQDAAEHLRSKILKFLGPKKRPDGAWQIFVMDPDGHFIEFCQVEDLVAV